MGGLEGEKRRKNVENEERNSEKGLKKCFAALD